MFSVVTSRSVRSARESDRINELNTRSSRDSGADHGTACINSIVGTPQSDVPTAYIELTLKLSGTMLRVRMTSNMHDFSSSAAYTFQSSVTVRVSCIPYSPVPKLGPPLKALPDHRCPCITPALTNSRKR